MQKIISILLIACIVVLACLRAHERKREYFNYEYKAESSTVAYSHVTSTSPLVNAGKDTTITLHSLTGIHGQKAIASDPDGTIVSYAWSKISGPGMQSLYGINTDSVTIVNLQEGTYKFRLLVTDNSGDQTSDTIQIIGRKPVTYTLNSTSGYKTIDNTVTVGGTTPTFAGGLLPGDTLLLASSGVYDAVSFQHLQGSVLDCITVKGNGSYSRARTGFAQTAWYDLAFVKFVNLKDSSWNGNHKASYGVHDVVFDHYIVANGDSLHDVAHFISSPWFTWDDQYSPVSMKFDGTKKSTFYNVTYQNCFFSGFKDVGIFQMGTAWNDSSTVERSICLDFKIIKNTFTNIINTTPGGGSGNRVVLINAVGWGWEVDGNKVKDFDEATYSFMHSHSVFIEMKGSLKFHNNYITNSFAALLRLTPLTWTKLPGYMMASYQFNNISFGQLAYSMLEINQNNKNQLVSSYGINEAPDTCVYNTTYVSRGQPDASRYYAFVVDFVNQNLGYVGYNVIVRPEIDFTYDSTGRSGYFVAIVSSAPSNLTKVGNFSAQFWNSYPIWDDTLNFIPSANSVLLNTGAAFTFRTYDYYYNPLVGTPDRGAVERQPNLPPVATPKPFRLKRK